MSVQTITQRDARDYETNRFWEEEEAEARFAQRGFNPKHWQYQGTIRELIKELEPRINVARMDMYEAGRKATDAPDDQEAQIAYELAFYRWRALWDFSQGLWRLT